MAMKQFKTESKRILDLMVNSIYTHKEIFLRELISNASDAIDKLYYKALSEGITGLGREDFKINIRTDKEARIIRIEDNGIGMTKDELDNNLGVIAKSGSLNFKKENEKKEDIDIIGQFGVGFYSAFMIADEVKVLSKAFGSNEAYLWQSKGAEGYKISEDIKENHGTVITLHVKENTEEENYDEFLEQYRIQSLIKKYSDYIRYPITMDMERSKKKEGTENEYEKYTETVTVNSMVPLWKKSKSELKEEDYNNFYKEKFYDFTDPVRVIHTSAEGTATYTALMFIPEKAPYNYYTREYEKGLELYSSGVMIMEKCSDLLPDYYSFVKGLVDSQDLSLNISREMLQHDRQLKLIAGRIEKKITAELKSMLANQREKYDEFFKAFGLQLKYGMYADYGVHKDTLKDLVLFYSSNEKKYVTLSEYVKRMKENQKDIYYACGETVEKIALLPQTQTVAEKGYEILFLTDDVDEFALKTLGKYEEKEFKNISSDKLDIISDEEKKETEKLTEENSELLEFMKEALNGKITKVKISDRLTKHPVCLSTEGHITLEMEKVLNQMPTDEKVKAQRVLEINAKHTIFETLKSLYENDKDKLKVYTDILYSQALLIEGFAIEDPVDYTNKICSLMTK
ncbi:MAG: molecular chaperone HtpG [Ruminococcaceae bacterium]|nr:molecular chaperone HtpG [Oscillospiraceae bacterium]